MAQTATTPERRQVHFNSHQEVLDDVHALAGQPTQPLGNWPLPAICQHLANAINLSIDGEVDFNPPLLRKLLARLLRPHFLKRGLPVGIRLPRQAEEVLYAPAESLESAVQALEKAIERLQSTSQRTPHPVLGKMNVAQWDQFHLRHAELHLSFIVPQQGAP